MQNPGTFIRKPRCCGKFDGENPHRPKPLKKQISMEDLNFRKGDAKTDVFGSNRMLQPSPVEKIPDGPTTPEVAYQMVKDETFAQTQPRLNLATFVTTYMD